MYMKSCYLEKLQEKDGASVQENETLGEFPDSDKYSPKIPWGLPGMLTWVQSADSPPVVLESWSMDLLFHKLHLVQDSNEIQTCDLLGFDSYGSYLMTSDDHYVAACAVWWWESDTDLCFSMAIPIRNHTWVFGCILPRILLE
jgi:hypothetical protein